VFRHNGTKKEAILYLSEGAFCVRGKRGGVENGAPRWKEHSFYWETRKMTQSLAKVKDGRTDGINFFYGLRRLQKKGKIDHSVRSIILSLPWESISIREQKGNREAGEL